MMREYRQKLTPPLARPAPTPGGPPNGKPKLLANFRVKVEATPATAAPAELPAAVACKVAREAASQRRRPNN